MDIKLKLIRALRDDLEFRREIKHLLNIAELEDEIDEINSKINI